MSGDEPELEVDPELRPGVWATLSRVKEGNEEFIVDLACSDPDDDQVAIVVARVRCSPRVAKELADDLNRAWRRYAHWALPKEVTDADPELESESEEDPGSSASG